MPTSKEIKKIAKRRRISYKKMARMVFGRMRMLGWKPKREGGPLKRWFKHKRGKR